MIMLLIRYMFKIHQCVDSASDFERHAEVTFKNLTEAQLVLTISLFFSCIVSVIRTS